MNNKKDNKDIKSIPIKDFQDITWGKRKVLIFFDSDKWDNLNVLHAEARFWKYLKDALNADCRVVNLTKEEKAKGIDDVLALPGIDIRSTLNRLVSRATTVPAGFATLDEKPTEIAHNVAKYIIQKHQMISLPKGVFSYQDGYYKLQDEPNLIKKIASELLELNNRTPSTQLLNEIYNQIAVLSNVSGNDVNPENMYNANNGILKLDIESGTVEFLEHNPGIIFTFKSEANYNLRQDCSMVQKFLDDIVPDKNQQKRLIEGLAYSIFPALRQLIEYTKMIVMYGSARNGKSILIGIMQRMIGEDTCGSTSLDQINSNERFQIASLYLKRANFSSENDISLIKETRTLKAITSGKDGDMIDVEFKHVNSFKAKVNPVLFFAINREPSLPADRTKALERRLNVIDFPYSFVDNPKLNTNEKKKDNRYENKKFTQPIVDGLLYLAVEEAKELIKRGTLWNIGAEESLNKAILSGSHFERFIDEYIELNSESATPSKELWSSYATFCIEEGIAEEYFDKQGNLKPVWHENKHDKPCKSADSLTKRLLKHFKSKIKSDFIPNSKGKKDRGFKGLRLKIRDLDGEEANANDWKPAPILDDTRVRELQTLLPAETIDRTDTPIKSENNAYTRIKHAESSQSTSMRDNATSASAVPTWAEKYVEDKHIGIEFNQEDDFGME